MNNLARKLENDALSHEIGRALGPREGGLFAVRTEAGEYRAKRAASCLLEPEVDDTVALLTTQSGVCYVTAVLEREAGATGRIVADGDLEIQLPAGQFTVAAQEGVTLLAAKEVAIVAGGLQRPLHVRAGAQHVDDDRDDQRGQHRHRARRGLRHRDGPGPPPDGSLYGPRRRHARDAPHQRGAPELDQLPRDSPGAESDQGALARAVSSTGAR